MVHGIHIGEPIYCAHGVDGSLCVHGIHDVQAAHTSDAHLCDIPFMHKLLLGSDVGARCCPSCCPSIPMMGSLASKADIPIPDPTSLELDWQASRGDQPQVAVVLLDLLVPRDLATILQAMEADCPCPLRRSQVRRLSSWEVFCGFLADVA